MTKQRAFTLIELMIVLAIVGILVAVVVGACSKKRAGDIGLESTTSAPAKNKEQPKNRKCP